MTIENVFQQLTEAQGNEVKLHHINRLQYGRRTLERGLVFNNLLTSLECVSDHCSNPAITITELQSDGLDAQPPVCHAYADL